MREDTLASVKKLLNDRITKQGRNLWAAIAVLVVAVAALTVAHDDSPPSSGLFVATGGDDASTCTQMAPCQSLGRALSIAGGGETIHIAPGEYPELRISDAFDEPVTLSGGGAASVAEVSYVGASGINLEGVSVDKGVYVQDSSRLVFRQCDLMDSDMGTTGRAVQLAEGVSYVSVRDSNIHDSRYGIVSAGRDNHHISIVGNDIARMKGDGINLYGTHEVLIGQNVIHDLVDPEGLIHNDAIQLQGFNYDTRIIGNRIRNSAGQGMIWRTSRGPIEGVVAANNLVRDTGAYGLQILDVKGARLAYNTFWNNGYKLSNRNALAVASADGNPQTDTELVGNILQSLVIAQGAEVAVREDNVYGAKGPHPPLNPGEIATDDPGFVDPAAGDYTLRPGALAEGAGYTAAGE